MFINITSVKVFRNISNTKRSVPVGHFQVPKSITLKTKLSAKPFLWK